MNKKSQIEIGGFELNPMALIFSTVGALISMIVMKGVEINIIFRILTPILTFIACYILTSIQFQN
jgi:hypothetical protein